MTTTMGRPTALNCACPGCNCTVKPETPFRSGVLLFCSDACAMGHPNGEPCHAGCGCECHAC
ncbi:conjugal transfer protein TrbI [Cyanobium sp. LEGE 06113]|nr:conjugal transfer protein TrbI [Cyanobium sp. LEGE 06113]